MNAEAETLPLEMARPESSYSFFEVHIFWKETGNAYSPIRTERTLSSCWRNDLNLHRALDRRGECLRDAPTNSFEHGCVGRFLVGTSGKNKFLRPITETLLTPLLER